MVEDVLTNIAETDKKTVAKKSLTIWSGIPIWNLVQTPSFMCFGTMVIQ